MSKEKNKSGEYFSQNSNTKMEMDRSTQSRLDWKASKNGDDWLKQIEQLHMRWSADVEKRTGFNWY